MPLSQFREVMEDNLSCRGLEFFPLLGRRPCNYLMILYTSVVIPKTMDVAFQWLLEHGPKYDGSVLFGTYCSIS